MSLFGANVSSSSPAVTLWPGRHELASFEVLKYRERARRDRLYFSEEFVRNIAADALASADNLESRRQALIHCLGKLKERDRELIKTAVHTRCRRKKCCETARTTHEFGISVGGADSASSVRVY